MTKALLRRKGPKKETESLLIVAQNSRIASINNVETVYKIMSEWRKLLQKKYKTTHDWGREKVILWVLYKRLKSDHTTKQHMQKAELV